MKKSGLVVLCFMLFLALIGCTKQDTSISTKENHENQLQSSDITNETLDHLYVFGKVWGFLKYYHPNVAEGKYDFDQELVTILPKIVIAKSSTERDEILTDWILELGDFPLEEKGNQAYDIKMEPDLDWISDMNLDSELEAQLHKVKNGKRTNNHHYVSLDKNIGNPIFTNEEAYSNDDYPDVEYRLVSLYRYWNIIEYYFPYKYLIEEDWDAVLKEFVPKFIEASNEKEYKLTTLELITRINDTHAQIISKEPILNEFWGENYAPLIIQFVEDKPTVTGYYNDDLGKDSGLEIGDVITEINGQPIEEILDEKLKYIPASNYTTKLRDIANKLLRTKESNIDVQYVRNGETYNRKVKTYNREKMDAADVNLYQQDKLSYEQISDDIAYIYPGSLKKGEITEIKSKLDNTKGLIIDLRSYPSDFIVYTLGEYLLPAPTPFVKLTSGSIKQPGLFTKRTELKVGENNKNAYQGKVVILINELTQSQAEFTAMAFRTAPNATVIGSTTAGADGNISRFTLPGGIKTSITGLGIYYPDGTETQRVGIVPDMTVKPTIKGLKENKDEVLEKAIQIINGE